MAETDCNPAEIGVYSQLQADMDTADFKIEYPAGLPVSERRGEIMELMRRNEEVRQQAEKLAEAEKAAGNKAGLQPVLSRSDAEELLMRIRYVLGNSSEIYTAGFSIGRLAELTESNVKYVSETINSLMGQNFSSLLAEQRVHEACRRMNDREHYGNVTIEAIAESVGIKSRSNFSQVFKRVTGLSPSEYQRMAKAV